MIINNYIRTIYLMHIIIDFMLQCPNISFLGYIYIGTNN